MKVEILAPILTVEEVTPEQINRHFAAMDDSVHLINEIIDADSEIPVSEENRIRVKCNIEHLNIMLGKSYIINDPRNKTTYIEASKRVVEGVE